MKIGLIARADNRGLGVTTSEFYRHMKPHRTLVIDMGDLSPYDNHFDRYPGEQVVKVDNTLRINEDIMKSFCSDVDIIYTAETPYDYDFFNIARDMGTVTVLHVNPEFHRYNVDFNLPTPDVFAIPTNWLKSQIKDALLLPVPVATDRLEYKLRTSATKFLHVAGHKAVADRNGTELIYQSASLISEPCEIFVRTQSELGRRRMRYHQAKVHTINEDRPEYWTAYDDVDVLLAPRRFGGLSLPMQEAAASGLPIISLDLSPQNEWLTKPELIPTRAHHKIRTQLGLLDCYDANFRHLVHAVNTFIRQPNIVESISSKRLEWREAMSWDIWRDKYLQFFEQAIKRTKASV